MTGILLAAVLLAQEEIPFPVFERDPWGACGVGSTVTRLIVSGKGRVEETSTLKAIDKESKTFTVSRTGQADEESTVKFVPFVESLTAPGGGYKVSGKSARQVTIGERRVKALVREVTPTQLSLNMYRITSADEMPGGIVDLTWKAEDDVTHSDVAYTMKGAEPVKVAGQTIECAKIELAATETKKKKRKIEGTFWISERVPGFLVRSRLKDTQDRVTTETTTEVLKFDLKKP